MANFKVILLLLLLLICACHNTTTTSKGVVTIDTAHVQYPHTPDFGKHIKPLFAFFALHQHLIAFDTDIDFADQGFGPIDDYDNFIEAGHLFSKTQVHAVLFYDFAVSNYRPLARLLIYKQSKVDGLWHQVLSDTIEVASRRYKFRDWNSDGIADLSCVWNGWDHGGHGPISWQLWLVDKQGIPHTVKDFEQIDDPKIDSFTGHIFSNTEYHNSKKTVEYKFIGNKIIKISDEMCTDYNSPSIVTYYRNNNVIKRIKLKEGKSIYTPKYESYEEMDY